MFIVSQTGLPGGHSGVEPPDPIPNSEVKRTRADGSVRSPHVRVGHCQAFKSKAPLRRGFSIGPVSDWWCGGATGYLRAGVARKTLPGF